MSATISNANIPRISFNELVSGSEGVRYTDIDRVQYMSVRDIIMVVCGKDNNDAGRMWRNLPETYKTEVQQFLLNFKFEGRGQSEQPVITLQGAIKLIMWLPGNMAKDFRSQACDILTRYLAGDQTMHAEINVNATSTAPINEFARASMPVPAHDALLEQSVANAAQLITTNTQLVATNERTSIAMVTHIDQFISTTNQLGGVVVQLTNANATASAALEKERHLRHQADGRYGSEVREANQSVRKQARYFEEMATDARRQLNMERKRIKREQQRADEKDKLIGQLVAELMASRRDQAS